MKKQTLYILLAAAIIAGAIIFFTKRRRDAFTEKAPPAPPQTGGNTPEGGSAVKAVNEDDPEAAQAIRTRMATIANNDQKRRQAMQQVGAENILFKGLRSPTGVKTILVPQQVASIAELPILPTGIPEGSAQGSVFSSVADAENFEPLHKKIGFDAAKQQWAGLADFGPFTLYTPLTEGLVLGGQFGSSGSADKNKSEQWGYWSADVKTFADNAQKLQEKLSKSIREQAINDLIATGWKIVGYNA
jgi:hypothetical protein